MAHIPVAPHAAGGSAVDPLADLQRLMDPYSVPPEHSHYLMKLLLARLPQNRKEELSVHLFPKALDLMTQNRLWNELSPFNPTWSKLKLPPQEHQAIQTSDIQLHDLHVEDPLTNVALRRGGEFNNEQTLNLLKLLLARLPTHLRHKVSPVLQTCCNMLNNRGTSQERGRGRGGYGDRTRPGGYSDRGNVGRGGNGGGRSGRFSSAAPVTTTTGLDWSAPPAKEVPQKVDDWAARPARGNNFAAPPPAVTANTDWSAPPPASENTNWSEAPPVMANTDWSASPTSNDVPGSEIFSIFTKKINISSFGDMLLMLDQLPDNLKPIMGIYLFKAANHYCNSYNYYLQQMSPKAYSYQCHAKGGVRSVSCECPDCRANGRGPPPSDGPTIEEIPNDEDKVAAAHKPQIAHNKTENFDHISYYATFSKDLKAAAEAHAKQAQQVQQQQQSSSIQNGVGGDQKNIKKFTKKTTSATTTSSSLLDEPVPQSSNHKFAEQSIRYSLNQEATTTTKVTNGTTLYDDIFEPVESKAASSSSSSSNEDIFTDSAPKISQPQSNGSFTTAAATKESVGGGVSTSEWSAKNPRTSPILSATAPTPTTYSSKPTITPRPVSAVSSGTAGSNSSFKIFDDSTFSSFFSDLKLPNGNTKWSLFDFSSAASGTSSKATTF